MLRVALVLGGDEDGGDHDHVYSYDYGADAWSEEEPLPEEYAYATGGSLGDCAYSIGGYNGWAGDEAGEAVYRLCE